MARYIFRSVSFTIIISNHNDSGMEGMFNPNHLSSSDALSVVLYENNLHIYNNGLYSQEYSCGLSIRSLFHFKGFRPACENMPPPSQTFDATNGRISDFFFVRVKKLLGGYFVRINIS